MPAVRGKGLTFRQMSRGAYFYQGPLPAGAFEWRDDLELAAPPETIEGLPREAFVGPWLVGPFREGLREPEASVLKPESGHPGAHRELASLWSKNDILGFANRYGHLLPMPEMPPLVQAGLSPAPLIYGDSLAQWRKEIMTLRRLLHFWDLVRSSDVNRLARFIMWESEHSVSVYWTDTPEGPQPWLKGLQPRDGVAGEPLAHKGLREHLLSKWRLGDVLEPMRLHVHIEVNKRLRGVSPHVLPYIPQPHRISFIPDSLRAACYLLFALELAGETETEVCKNPKCPKPGRRFAKTRGNQQFCSERCRKHYFDLFGRKKPVSTKESNHDQA